jgi:hypothetical protein
MRPSPFFFQQVLDHLLSIALVLFLMGLAVQVYPVAQQLAEVCARVASQSDLRFDVQYHYALTGEWPKDLDTMLRTRLRGIPYQPYAGDEVALEDGAIRILATQGSIRGKVISLRPATMAGNAIGPVAWVVGTGADVAGRAIQGLDHTTVERDLIQDLME